MLNQNTRCFLEVKENARFQRMLGKYASSQLSSMPTPTFPTRPAQGDSFSTASQAKAAARLKQMLNKYA